MVVYDFFLQVEWLHFSILAMIYDFFMRKSIRFV